MRRFIALVALLASGPSLGASWVQVATHDVDVEYYVDTNSIKPFREWLQASIRVASVQPFPSLVEYRSYQSLNAYDCARGLTAPLSFKWYKNATWNGRTVAIGNIQFSAKSWMKPSLTTSPAHIMQFVCEQVVTTPN